MSTQDRAEFDMDYENFERAVKRAVRGGLESRAIHAWISGRRALGDSHSLHNLPEWNTDLPGRIDAADVWIALHATPLIERGYSVERVRRSLLRQLEREPWPLRATVGKRLGTRQNLHQRLAALGIPVRPSGEE
jgi:hypothetical protein